VEHTPTIPLASLLQSYRFTAKMKAALAYILAQSVWKFYDSDWMSTRWTSETVQFVKEFTSLLREGEPGVYAFKPYVSVQFGEHDADACESSSTVGEIHRYPRVRFLGIMLVEIGHGLLPPRAEDNCHALSRTAQMNRDLFQAIEISNSKKPWPDFDYPKYRLAVKNCLSPDIFMNAPSMPDATADQLAEGLRERRRILFDSVISPLEDLLQGTGWKEELNQIGPLIPSERRQATSPVIDLPDLSSQVSTTKLRRAAENWLDRVRYVNEQLKLGRLTSHINFRHCFIQFID
jgi:hypothetical protein